MRINNEFVITLATDWGSRRPQVLSNIGKPNFLRLYCHHIVFCRRIYRFPFSQFSTFIGPIFLRRHKTCCLIYLTDEIKRLPPKLFDKKRSLFARYLFWLVRLSYNPWDFLQKLLNPIMKSQLHQINFCHH